MTRKNPCYGCRKRQIGCHTFCHEGMAFDAFLAERKRKKDAERDKEYFSEFAKKATIKKIREGRK